MRYDNSNDLLRHFFAMLYEVTKICLVRKVDRPKIRPHHAFRTPTKRHAELPKRYESENSGILRFVVFVSFRVVVDVISENVHLKRTPNPTHTNKPASYHETNVLSTISPAFAMMFWHIFLSRLLYMYISIKYVRFTRQLEEDCWCDSLFVLRLRR